MSEQLAYSSYVTLRVETTISRSQIRRHNLYYQRVSIASYASAGIARPEMSVRLRLSVCPSHSGIVSERRKIAS